MSEDQTENPAAGLVPLQKAIEAAGLKSHPATIRRAMAAGLIRGARVGGRWLTTPDAIVAAMVRQVGPATPAQQPLQVAQ